MPYIVVFITTPTKEEADIIANALVDFKIAACVNILPGVKSVYTWKGRREVSCECLLLVKTKKSNFTSLKAKVKSLHSYESPEIISVLVDDGDENYLKWIEEAAQDA